MRPNTPGDSVVVPVKLLVLALVLIASNLCLTVWWHNTKSTPALTASPSDAWQALSCDCEETDGNDETEIASPKVDRRQLESLIRKEVTVRSQVTGYIKEPKCNDAEFLEVRAKVAKYLASPEFAAKQKALQDEQDPTKQKGIVICTGGSKYLPQALVLLRALRHHVKCKLPIELVWVGDDEMDPATFKELQREFAPLYGYDATKAAYPEHHRKNPKLKGFPVKAFAVYQSRFREVLLFDADVIPLRDPTYMFDDPQYKAHGNLFWPDIYSDGMLNEEAYEWMGLDRGVAKKAIYEGKGPGQRYAESGQVMVNRAQHLDVLEWTWFLNAFGEGYTYKLMFGDKDTFAFAFALAEKANYYSEIGIPPSGIFTHMDNLNWKPPHQQLKKQGAWWLQSLVHHDSLGNVLHQHRVTAEIFLDAPIPKDEVITPPIPLIWSMWFMGYGPNNDMQRTIEVSFTNITHLLAEEQSSPATGKPCPLTAWAAYWRFRSWGIPIARDRALEAACLPALQAAYGAERVDALKAAGLLEQPMFMNINKAWDSPSAKGWTEPSSKLWAVPVNMTEAQLMTGYIEEGILWGRRFAKQLPLLGGVAPVRKGHGHGKHHKAEGVADKAAGASPAVGKQRRLLAVDDGGEVGVPEGDMPALHPAYQRHMLA